MDTEPPQHNIPDGFVFSKAIKITGPPIKDMRWSLDGRFLATFSKSSKFRIWEPLDHEDSIVLAGHKNEIYCLAWAPDGNTIASGSADNTVRLWNLSTHKETKTLTGHRNRIASIDWSPDGNLLASGSDDRKIKIWTWPSGELLYTLDRYGLGDISLSWSPLGDVLAAGSVDGNTYLWNTNDFAITSILRGESPVQSIAWSNRGEFIASAHSDSTIRLWDSQTGLQIFVLEGHTKVVRGIEFSYDDQFLISQSYDGTLRLWRADTGELVSRMDFPTSGNLGGIAFHPSTPILATRNEMDNSILIWELDFNKLLATTLHIDKRVYSNAKVVLLGDSGVGKTGLSLVLTDQEFKPTESSHARIVWLFEQSEKNLQGGFVENREVLLWDLAGQPGYRLIHQLHLNEVAVALIVFDARGEIDPFSGVKHWVRALNHAERIHGARIQSVPRFLISARVDRQGIPVSKKRIEKITRELGFHGYYETSAKENWNIEELKRTIRETIDWDKLPRISSNTLFQTIKNFIVTIKRSGLILLTENELYRSFCKEYPETAIDQELFDKFRVCIGRVESRGLIKKLSFGNYILLQPEKLDSYGSSIVNSARSEPDGLGFVAEEIVLDGRIRIAQDERVADEDIEKILLISTVEELISHEIAFREITDSGVDIVFPSEFSKERSDAAYIKGKHSTIDFEGPTRNVYSTLVVRLSRTTLFVKKELWKNVAVFESDFEIKATLNAGVEKAISADCGIIFNLLDEGRGQFVIFFGKNVEDQTKYHFEMYLLEHLKRKAIPHSISRALILVCSECGSDMNKDHVEKRAKRGFDYINCPVCDNLISFEVKKEIPDLEDNIRGMDFSADNVLHEETRKIINKGKREAGVFDVFMCYNHKDKEIVLNIAQKLRDNGIIPWIDEWELRPGLPWQRLLEEQIDKINSVAVFVGPSGIGPWQNMELEAFLREFVDRNMPVIPVVLDGTARRPILPIFLKGNTWVDFRKRDMDPIRNLIWGITGIKIAID